MRNEPVTLNKEKKIAIYDEEAPKYLESSSDKKKEAKEKFVAPITEETLIPKEYFQSQKATNAPNLISQLEQPAPKKMADPKMRTDVSVLSVGTCNSLTPEKRIPGKKKNTKSLAMMPPRKDPITNQYKDVLGTKKIKVFHHN